MHYGNINVTRAGLIYYDTRSSQQYLLLRTYKESREEYDDLAVDKPQFPSTVVEVVVELI